MNYKSLAIILSFFLITFGISQAFSFASAQETTITDTSRTDTSRTPIPERTPPTRELSPESLPVTFSLLESVVYSIFDIPYFLVDLFSEIVGDVCASLLPSLWDAVNALGGVSGLVGVAVGIFNLIFGGVWEIAQSLGITVAAALGAGIVGLILGVVNLAFNVINFIYTTGVGGISVAGLLISIIAVFISVVMSIFLSVLVLINFAMLFLSGLLFSILIGGLFLLIFAITTTILAVGIVVLKLQQLATTGLSFPFGFISLITIVSAIPEILSLILPLGISWLGVIAYPFIWLGGVVSMFPIIGFGIAVVGLTLLLGGGIIAAGLAIAFIIFVVGTGLSVVLGVIGAIFGAAVGIIISLIFSTLWFPTLLIPLVYALGWIGAVIVIFIVAVGGGALIAGGIPFVLVVVIALAIVAIFTVGGLLIGGGILLVGIILLIPSLILAPLFGFILLTVILPLIITGILFIFSFGWELVLIAWILLENIFSFITMVINFIGIFILQIFLQTIQTITISEIVSVIVLFINRIASTVPCGSVIGGILQAIVGMGMLLLAALFAGCNVVCYPFNLCWTMCTRFCGSVLHNVPVLDIRNWVRRPLGWT